MLLKKGLVAGGALLVLGTPVIASQSSAIAKFLTTGNVETTQNSGSAPTPVTSKAPQPSAVISKSPVAAYVPPVVEAPEAPMIFEPTPPAAIVIPEAAPVTPTVVTVPVMAQAAGVAPQATPGAAAPVVLPSSGSLLAYAQSMFGDAWKFVVTEVGDAIALVGVKVGQSVEAAVEQLTAASGESVEQVLEAVRIPVTSPGGGLGSQPGTGVGTPPPVTPPALELPTPASIVYEVHTQKELLQALVDARTKGAADILVHPGDYGTLIYTNKKHTLGRVRVMAASKTRPVFTGANLSSSSGLLIQGMEFSGDTKVLVYLNSTANMVFVDNKLRGATTDKNPWNDNNTGIHVRWAKGVTVSDNSFEDLRVALYLQQSSDLTVRYNTLRYMREGFNIAATTGLDIVGNHFSLFFPNYGRGEHPDAIQFWTRNEKQGSHNVKLIENFIAMGGPRAVQGIFAASENFMRHRNFEVSRNVYYGSSPHGISLYAVDGVNANNNVVLASPHGDSDAKRSPDGRASAGTYPKVMIRESTDVKAWNNIAVSPVNPEGGTSWDNWLIVSRPKAGTPWDEAFVARPTAEAPALTEFVTKVGAPARAAEGGIIATFRHGAQPSSVSKLIGDAVKAHKG